jgi:Undecaprenyl-phosphate glucose phosphotransferase
MSTEQAAEVSPQDLPAGEMPSSKEYDEWRAMLKLPSTGNARIERLLLRIGAVEILTIVVTCCLTSVAYFRIVLTDQPPAFEYIAAALLIAAVEIATALSLKQYVAIQVQPRERFMLSGLSAVAFAFSVFLSLLFLLKLGSWYSRGVFFTQLLSVSVAVLLTRAYWHNHVLRAVQSGTVKARKAILVGDTNANTDLLRRLRQRGIHWEQILSLPQVHKSGARRDAPYSPVVQSFVEQCRRVGPDDIIFLASPRDLDHITALVNPLSELPISVHVIPTGENELWHAATLSSLGGLPTFQVVYPPLSQFDLTIKRVFDLSTSAFGLLMLSPLMLTVALAIKIDSPGPVFFRQNRHGYNNEPIPVLKFRTMNVIEDGETTSTFTQARTNDRRLTRIGRVLRRTNIDELPQLFNVLRGEMSIVGPRPHPLALNSLFRERIMPFSRRHNVKPGLTGWAQVHGLRGETNTVQKMQRRVEYDLYYIDNWSFMLDLKIVLMTLFSKNAYQNAF